MMNGLPRTAIRLSGLLLLIGLLLWTPRLAWAERATIAVASNFLTTAEQLKLEFELQNPQHELALVQGATGKLYAQIIAGAPFDMLLAADAERPSLLVEQGFGHADQTFTYAVGRLAIAGRELGSAEAGEVQQIDDFLPVSVSRIAIANPAVAPYGKAALEVLSTSANADKHMPKLITGNSVGQTYAAVATGAAQIGFVALSQIKSSEKRVQLAHALISDKLHAPILQDAVLLSLSADNASAVKFLAFLRSDKARELIRNAGYNVPNGSGG
jgi:molybdate transport system substrate-binding protein